MLFYRFVVRHWLLLMQLRHYTAFVAICSRVAKRSVHDVSDLRVVEAFKIWYKFSSDSFASYNAFLKDNVSSQAQDDFLASIKYNDHYRRLRIFLCWARRATMTLAVVLTALAAVGLLGPLGVAYFSFLPFIGAAFVAYYLWLNLRCMRLHKLFPQACREWIAQLGLSENIKINSVYHLRSLPLYTLHNFPRTRLFTPLETLTLRSLRDFRVRQDAHAPIAEQLTRIAKNYPQGIKNYLLELSTADARYREATLPLRLEHNAPINTVTLTSMLYDATMLEIAQKILRNTDRVILLSSATKIENLKSLITHYQPEVNETAEKIVRERLPQWRTERMTMNLDKELTPVVSIFRCEGKGNRYWKEDIQTFLYFFTRENGDAHTRVVTDDNTLRTFLASRFITNVQSDFSDILLRKHQDPRLATIVISQDANAAEKLTLPLNYVVIVISD